MFRIGFGHSRRRGQPASRLRTRPQLELLESRDVPSTFQLTPLVQVSSTSPFDGSPIEANDPAFARNSEVEPYVAVDPTNAKHLVGAWIQDFARGIVAAVSFDAGDTWRSVVIPGGGTLAAGGTHPHAADPWVSFAPNGDVYLSFQGFDFPVGTPADILVSKSTDGGLSWRTPTTIVTGGNDFNDKPTITADPTNAQFAYVTWTRFRFRPPFNDNRGTTMFSRTTDGGQTWEPAREILDEGAHNADRGQQIVVLPDGTLLNFFGRYLFKNSTGGVNHNDFQLAFIRSSDHGQTWSTVPTPVAAILAFNDATPGGVPNPDGGLNIRCDFTLADVAVDPSNGNLYAVWQDARFSNFQYSSIAFSMSTNGGVTWSTPIKINQTPDTIPVSNRQAFLPSVAVNQDGVVAVTYFDIRNNTPAPGLPTDLWMVHAHPGNLTNPSGWSSENRMTPASFNIENAPAPPDGYFVGDYEGMVAMGKNFGGFWSMPTATDSGSIFFRDPLPTESTPESEVHVLPAEVREVSSLHGIDLPSTDLGGTTLGIVPGRSIWLDSNAVAWGWFYPTPHDDSEFTTPGNQGEMNRLDLLTVLDYGLGHMLGFEHTASGVMAETLPPGTRCVPSFSSDLGGLALLDQVFADGPVAQAW
jgi:hypothetical protein